MYKKSTTSEELASFRSLASIKNLAEFLQTTPSRLSFYLYSPKRPGYKIFTIPKAAGGLREIRSPPPVIASFQKKVLRCMTAMFTPRGPSHAFTIGRSVVSNARKHVGVRLLLNVDLVDFFHSINFGRVRGVFAHHPFNFTPQIATMLAQMCCYQGVLPQGAPTSPLISNFICRSLDRDLLELARRYKCKYTRYADDITFSTNLLTFPAAIVTAASISGRLTPALGHELVAVFDRNDFKPNPRKIRLRDSSQRQEVTGIVVNSRPNLKRTYVRNLRAILRDCRTRGMALAEERFREVVPGANGGPPPALADYLHGKLDYLWMVRGNEGDVLYSRYALELEKLAPRRKYGVRLKGDAAHDSRLLLEAIWIVVGYDEDNYETQQGTGFSLDGIGIVTAEHVFADPGACVWRVIRASSPTESYDVKARHSDSHLDLAVLETNARHVATLLPASAEAEVRDYVSIVGFPNWHSTADKLSIFDARVTQTKIVNGVSLILTNGTVRTGNSGGPILDQHGRVVGVALGDGSHPVHPNGGVAIKHVQDIHPQAPP